MGDDWQVIVVDDQDPRKGILQSPLQRFPGAPSFLLKSTIHDLLSALTPEIPLNSLSSSTRRCQLGQLNDGDILIIHSVCTWKTYGIVSNARERKVICFATRDRCPVSDIGALCSLPSTDICLREVGLDELSHVEDEVMVVQQKDPAKTLQNAKVALARERPWSFFRFNSEHFVTCAMTGEPKSPQLDTLLAFLQKAVISGALSALNAKVLQACSKCVVKKVVKPTIIIIVVVTQRVLQVTMGKSTGITVMTSLFLAQITVKEVTEEVVEATATSAGRKLFNGVKAGLIGGALVEGAFLFGSLYRANGKLERHEITKEQYEEHKMKRIGGSGGSLAGGAVGSAIGTVLMPGVGTFIGSVVGGLVGDYVGSKCGECVYKENHKNEKCTCGQC